MRNIAKTISIIAIKTVRFKIRRNVQVKISIVRAPRDIDVLLAVAFVLFNCKENTLATIIRYLEARIEALVY